MHGGAVSTPAPVTASEVIAQLHVAGLLPFMPKVSVGASSVSGCATLTILGYLRQHPAFYEDIWNFLHPEIPEPRTGFRSYTGAFGDGSTQIVICTETGHFHADVDGSNTQDVVNIVAHLATDGNDAFLGPRGKLGLQNLSFALFEKAPHAAA